jgi:hypothetical protein
LPEERTDRRVIYILVIIFAVLSIISAITIAYEYYPKGKTVIFRNGADIDFIFVREDNFLVPVRAYFSHEQSQVELYYYFNNASNYFYRMQNIMLSSTGNSIFTLKQAKFSPQIENGNVVVSVEVGHTLNVSTHTEPYVIEVFYKKIPSGFYSETEMNNKFSAARVEHEPLDFIWTVRTVDFGKPTYFWIIFAGVTISRIFSFTRTEGGITTVKLEKLDLLWIPVSAVITLLIFSSFREQVNLTTDIMTNLALAFGFGFGFDKIFETWSRSPAGKR